MTPKLLKELSIQHQGYETPELNDKLYLHFKGFAKVENLEPYVNLNALWLESNGLREIGSGLAHLTKLRCLYVQQNMLLRIEGIETLVFLCPHYCARAN